MLTGKRVFISGGTGVIGASIVRACRRYNAEVVFTYKQNKTWAHKLAKETHAKAIEMNLLDLNSIHAAAREVDKRGPVDVIINNAGVAQVMPFSLIEEDDYDYVMDVNVKGLFFVTKALLKGMIREKKGGSIVTVSSIAGHRLYEVPVHYAMSKAAVTGFTNGLASELRKFGIRVNSVCPGIIKGGVSKEIPEAQKQDFLRHCAMGREGTGDEVAETVCFLASDKSLYINAQDIFIDGGI